MKTKSRKLTKAELLKMAKGRPGYIRTAQFREGNFVTLYFARLGGKNVGDGSEVLFPTKEKAVEVARSAKETVRKHLKIS